VIFEAQSARRRARAHVSCACAPAAALLLTAHLCLSVNTGSQSRCLKCLRPRPYCPLAAADAAPTGAVVRFGRRLFGRWRCGAFLLVLLPRLLGVCGLGIFSCPPPLREFRSKQHTEPHVSHTHNAFDGRRTPSATPRTHLHPPCLCFINNLCPVHCVASSWPCRRKRRGPRCPAPANSKTNPPAARYRSCQRRFFNTRHARALPLSVSLFLSQYFTSLARLMARQVHGPFGSSSHAA